ncbi:hypothetical protein B0O99DRAFT_735873 [Bisporella sp. PMI_857]|nr:hypothetical protein B0O99DRAFT_735873 [Bisporella sp. PMI_857]
MSAGMRSSAETKWKLASAKKKAVVAGGPATVSRFTSAPSINRKPTHRYYSDKGVKWTPQVDRVSWTDPAVNLPNLLQSFGKKRSKKYLELWIKQKTRPTPESLIDPACFQTPKLSKRVRNEGDDDDDDENVDVRMPKKIRRHARKAFLYLADDEEYERYIAEGRDTRNPDVPLSSIERNSEQEDNLDSDSNTNSGSGSGSDSDGDESDEDESEAEEVESEEEATEHAEWTYNSWIAKKESNTPFQTRNQNRPCGEIGTWTEEEFRAIWMVVKAIRDHERKRGVTKRDALKDVRLWTAVAKRLKKVFKIVKGFNACKSWWNRYGRRESQFDERVDPDQTRMVTSGQGANARKPAVPKKTKANKGRKMKGGKKRRVQ